MGWGVTKTSGFWILGTPHPQAKGRRGGGLWGTFYISQFPLLTQQPRSNLRKVQGEGSGLKSQPNTKGGTLTGNPPS